MENQSQNLQPLSHNPNAPVEQQPIREGEKAKDFVQRLLTERAAVSAPQPQQQQPVQTVEQDVAAAKAAVEAETAPAPKAEPAPSFDFVEPKREMGPAPSGEAKAAPAPEQPASEEPPDEPVPGSLPANYKLLKTTYKEVKQKFQQTEAEKAALAEELERYKTGTVVPEILQQKEQEIARLSTYERLFNVKGSKAYKEQVIQPLTQSQQELKQLFKDYEIPETEVEKFTSLTNRADRNRFLDEHFDRRGADQAEQLLQKTAAIRGKAKELESGSETAIQSLEAEHQRIEAEREVQRKNSIAENAKDSWVRALLKIRSENSIKELIPKANDQAFNERIVNPILTAASVEYGKFVTHLAESGVKELTPAMAEYAARMSLLAHASAVATKTRDAALEYAEQAEEGTRIGNGYFRPSVGGGVPSMASKAPAKPTLEQGVDGLLGSIISKRR